MSAWVSPRSAIVILGGYEVGMGLFGGRFGISKEVAGACWRRVSTWIGS